MANISAGDAALYGLQAFRKDPLAMVLYFVLFVASFAAITFAFGGQIAEAFSNYMAALSELETAQNPQDVFPGISAAATELMTSPGILISTLVWAVIAVLFQTALLRIMLKDDARGFMNFGFGADEVRVLVANVIVYVLVYAAIIILALIVGLVTGLAAQLIGGFAVLLSIVGVIAVMAFAAYLAAIFSTSSALSVQRGGFYVFGAPKFMKGFGGSILGAHVLGFFILIIASIAVWIVSAIVATAVGINLMSPDPSATGFGEVRYIPVQAVTYIGTIINALIWVGIPAYYVRRLSEIDAGAE